MGKTTDAFTQKFRDLSKESQRLVELIVELANPYRKLVKEWEQLEMEHDEITRQIHKQRDKEIESIAEVEKDPTILKLNKQLDQLGQQMEEIGPQLDKAKKRLGTVTHELMKETTAFENYINKKAKALFKRKRSLPAAKVLLKSAEELIEKNKVLLPR